jgi:PTH1 family peptidyl-tRNA hydrolase
MVVSRLARKHGISFSHRRFRARYGQGEICGTQVFLIKPYAYMNLSGNPVNRLLAAYHCSLDDLIVVHDDLDLDFGSIRIKRKGGHGGHRGVRSIIQALDGSEFTRLKVGIGRPSEESEPSDFVLDPFEQGEREHLDEILSRAVAAVETLLVEGVEEAMNAFNTEVNPQSNSKQRL